MVAMTTLQNNRVFPLMLPFEKKLKPELNFRQIDRRIHIHHLARIILYYYVYFNDILIT